MKLKYNYEEYYRKRRIISFPFVMTTKQWKTRTFILIIPVEDVRPFMEFIHRCSEE